jgi:hypothetical protein
MKSEQHISREKTVIGIDVSKDKLDVFIDGPDEHFTCLNQIKHLQKLAKRFKKISPALIVMEATGGYETAAAIGVRRSRAAICDSVSPARPPVCSWTRYECQDR